MKQNGGFSIRVLLDIDKVTQRLLKQMQPVDKSKIDHIAFDIDSQIARGKVLVARQGIDFGGRAGRRITDAGERIDTHRDRGWIRQNNGGAGSHANLNVIARFQPLVKARQISTVEIARHLNLRQNGMHHAHGMGRLGYSQSLVASIGTGVTLSQSEMR